MASIARGMVSMKKVRFQEDGFDLDLTYITPRVIAMGFPSYGMESVYRNPADEVERFFKTRHKGHYRVYNLCSERKYDKDTRFNGRFKHFPFDDHNPPAPISIIPDFVNDVKTFLAEDPRNVVAIHCKAGKGRTGVVITTYLMDQFKEYRGPKEALERFGSLRTHDGKGVTIPSQHRYVGYWDKMISMFDSKPPPAPPRRIEKITVSGGSPKWDLYFIVAEGPKAMGADAHVMYDTRKPFGFKKAAVGGGSYSFDLSDQNVVVRGDVKVSFKEKKRMGSDEPLFHFWFHTCFEKDGPFTLSKFHIDKAAKDGKHEKYKPDLSLCMTLGPAPSSSLRRGDSGLLRVSETGSPKAQTPSPKPIRIKTPSPTPSDSDDEDAVKIVDNTPPTSPTPTPPQRRRVSLSSRSPSPGGIHVVDDSPTSVTGPPQSPPTPSPAPRAQAAAAAAPPPRAQPPAAVPPPSTDAVVAFPPAQPVASAPAAAPPAQPVVQQAPPPTLPPPQPQVQLPPQPAVAAPVPPAVAAAPHAHAQVVPPRVAPAAVVPPPVHPPQQPVQQTVAPPVQPARVVHAPPPQTSGTQGSFANGTPLSDALQTAYVEPPQLQGSFLDTKLDDMYETHDTAPLGVDSMVLGGAAPSQVDAAAAAAVAAPEILPVAPAIAAAMANGTGPKPESAAEKRLRELREKREARQREREEAKSRREEERRAAEQRRVAAQEGTVEDLIAARKHSMEQKQKQRDSERLARAGGAGDAAAGERMGVRRASQTAAPPAATEPPAPPPPILGSPERKRALAERDAELLRALEETKKDTDERHRRREAGRQGLRPIDPHLLRQRENDFGTAPKRDPSTLDPWNLEQPGTPTSPPGRASARAQHLEPYTPTQPPPSDTQSGSDVVELARGIIERVRAIESSCAAIAQRGGGRYAGKDPPPQRFAPPEPVDRGTQPLPVVALSLLQRSARLEIMCSEETAYREIRSTLRRAAVRAR